MVDKFVKKGLVIGIIVLFIGVGFASSYGIFLMNKPSIINSNVTTLYVGGSDSNNGSIVFVYDNSSTYLKKIYKDSYPNLWTQ